VITGDGAGQRTKSVQSVVRALWVKVERRVNGLLPTD